MSKRMTSRKKYDYATYYARNYLNLLGAVEAFTAKLKEHGIRISMDGRGRWTMFYLNGGGKVLSMRRFT